MQSLACQNEEKTTVHYHLIDDRAAENVENTAEYGKAGKNVISNNSTGIEKYIPINSNV